MLYLATVLLLRLESLCSDFTVTAVFPLCWSDGNGKTISGFPVLSSYNNFVFQDASILNYMFFCNILLSYNEGIWGSFETVLSLISEVTFIVFYCISLPPTILYFHLPLLLIL